MAAFINADRGIATPPLTPRACQPASMVVVVKVLESVGTRMWMEDWKKRLKFDNFKLLNTPANIFLTRHPKLGTKGDSTTSIIQKNSLKHNPENGT